MKTLSLLEVKHKLKTQDIFRGKTVRELVEHIDQQAALLSATMPCGHLERYAAHDALDRKYCVMCKAEKLQSENGFLNGVIAGQDVQS